jgi:histone H3/H4
VESAEKYRQFAEDCRRLAGKAAPKDKIVLLEIAEAWEQCAKDAGRKTEKTTDGKDTDSFGVAG